MLTAHTRPSCLLPPRCAPCPHGLQSSRLAKSTKTHESSMQSQGSQRVFSLENARAQKLDYDTIRASEASHPKSTPLQVFSWGGQGLPGKNSWTPRKGEVAGRFVQQPLGELPGEEAAVEWLGQVRDAAATLRGAELTNVEERLSYATYLQRTAPKAREILDRLRKAGAWRLPSWRNRRTTGRLLGRGDRLLLVGRQAASPTPSSSTKSAPLSPSRWTPFSSTWTWPSAASKACTSTANQRGLQALHLPCATPCSGRSLKRCCLATTWTCRRSCTVSTTRSSSRKSNRSSGPSECDLRSHRVAAGCKRQPLPGQHQAPRHV